MTEDSGAVIPGEHIPSTPHEYFRPAPLPPASFTVSEDLTIIIEECEEHLEALAEVIAGHEDESEIRDAVGWEEACASSKIEGIPKPYSTVSLDPETGRIDVPEVKYCDEAVKLAIERIGQRSDITESLAHELHETLIREGFNESNLGAYRDTRVYIGGGEPQFVPVPPSEVARLMARLYSYLQNEGEFHWLVEAALVHYQFETIHPYIDGNGRVGRAIMAGQLHASAEYDGMVVAPSVGVLNRRQDYYSAFQAVRAGGGWTHWCTFIIECITESAERLIEFIQNNDY